MKKKNIWQDGIWLGELNVTDPALEDIQCWGPVQNLLGQ